jgi:hypothetical protein
VLDASLLAITVLQLVVQYRLNVWNRDFFNAPEFMRRKKKGGPFEGRPFFHGWQAAACHPLKAIAQMGRPGQR